MNSNKNVLIGSLAAIVLVALIGFGTYAYLQRETKEPKKDTTTQVDSNKDKTVIPPKEDDLTSVSFKSEKGVAITLTSPQRGASVRSPLKVNGTIPGTWSNEGEFQLRLLDNSSNVLAEGTAKISGDWMTDKPVVFTGELTFAAPASGTMGLLVLERANPSGLQDKADSLTVPVQF